MKNPFERHVDRDGVQLRVVGRPMSDPRGAVVIVPGFAEHAGRYFRLMRDLNARGYASYTYDPRGHGRSSGGRGDTPSWAALADDLSAVVDDLEAQGDLRARSALWASSMGALLAAEWLPAQRKGRFNGAVFVAPYFAPAFPPPAGKVLLARTIGALVPWLAQPHGLRGREMSRDPMVVAAYDSDPELTRVMSARYFNAMRAAQARVAARGADGLDIPILLVMGGEDPIASLVAAQAFMRTATAPGSETRVYPGLLHEPLNEIDGVRVFADIARWLNGTVLDVSRHGP
jgi:alpha-beta hydrolase superfamily lysophospholipase